MFALDRRSWKQDRPSDAPMLRAVASVRVPQLETAANSSAWQLLHLHRFCGKPQILALSATGNSKFSADHADIQPTWRQDYTWTDAVVHLPTTDPPTGLLHSSCSVRV